MKKLLLILSLTPFLLSAQDWHQIDQDIDGDSVYDNSGWSV